MWIHRGEMTKHGSIYEPFPVTAIVTDPASTIVSNTLASSTRQRLNTAVRNVRTVARERWASLDVHGPYAETAGYQAFKLSHESWLTLVEHTDLGDETIELNGETWLLRQRVWTLLMEQYTAVVIRDSSVDISTLEAASRDTIQGPQRFLVRSK